MDVMQKSCFLKSRKNRLVKRPNLGAFGVKLTDRNHGPFRALKSQRVLP